MNKLLLFAFSIVVIFSLFGLFIAGNLLHELSHKQDFRKYAYDDSLCFLMIAKNRTFSNFFNSPVAQYTFNTNKTDEIAVDKIEKYTEWKAYSLDIILAIIVITSIIIILHHLKENEYLQKYNEFLLWRDQRR